VFKGENLQQEGRFLISVESLWFKGQHKTPGGGRRQEGEESTERTCNKA